MKRILVALLILGVSALVGCGRSGFAFDDRPTRYFNGGVLIQNDSDDLTLKKILVDGFPYQRLAGVEIPPHKAALVQFGYAGDYGASFGIQVGVYDKDNNRVATARTRVTVPYSAKRVVGQPYSYGYGDGYVYPDPPKIWLVNASSYEIAKR